MDIRNFITALETSYPIYKEKNFSDKNIKHKDIVPLIQKLSENTDFDVQEIGKSVEQRSIYKIAIGKGSETILIWSQMHGNEPTGTMAIFDVLNYLQKNTEKPFVKEWLSNFRLHFIPMLNPDGAERYQRRNALNIDINRDALALQTPEAQLLSEWRDILQPQWAFNLHDQIPHYSAGTSDNPACISFLVPAYNQAEEINELRAGGMQFLGLMKKLINPFIPNMIARYWSTYSARCFGENFQTKGTNTLLIESGTYPFEYNKETPRKINYIILLAGIEILLRKHHENETIESYTQIPENRRNFYDLIIHNLQWQNNSTNLHVDIAVNRYEEPNSDATQFVWKSEIMDIGDLSTEFAYLHYDAHHMQLKPALMFPEAYQDASVIFPHFTLSNFRKGYLLFPMKNFDPDNPYNNIEFHVVPENYQAPEKIQIGKSADFYLEKNEKAYAVVVNGELRELN